MGKGTGACLSSEAPDKPAPAQPAAAPKPAAPAPADPAPAAAPATPAPPAAKPATAEAPAKPAPTAEAPITATKVVKMPTVYIVYYSMYGHIKTLVEAVKKGVEGEGVDVKIFQVAETLPAEVLEKMHAPPKADYPVLDPHDLPAADGFVFAFPTRFGRVASQFGAFLDATGQHWQKGALVGKPVTFVTSSASQGGGQESTIINALPFVAHQGMIYVPPGFTAGGPMFGLEAPRGGSAWGAGTFAGPTGARQPSEDELAVSTSLGKHFAGIVKKLAA